MFLGGVFLLAGGYSFHMTKEQAFHPYFWKWVQLLKGTGKPDLFYIFIGILLILSSLGIWFRESSAHGN